MDYIAFCLGVICGATGYALLIAIADFSAGRDLKRASKNPRVQFYMEQARTATHNLQSALDAAQK